MSTDAAGFFVDVNETFSRITDYAAEEVLGKIPKNLKSGRQSPAFYEGMWDALLTQGCWRREIWDRRKNGEIDPEMHIISALKNAAGLLQH
jgi:PAS domain S-box-containing protein